MLYSDPESARYINRLRLLNSVYRRQNPSRAELARRLKLNKMTISSIVQELLEEGILRESGKISGTPGRSGTALSINPDYGSVLLIDAGLWKTRVGIVDTAGETRLLEAFSTKNRDDPSYMLETLAKRIGLFKKNLADGPKGVKIIGLAAAMNGLVDRQRGMVKHSPNWGWHDVPAAELLARDTGLPCTIDNNVRAMLSGEEWFGNIEEAPTIFYVNWAEGIGSAIMHNRVVLDIDSEFGHIPVSDTGACSCGKIGCLEAHAAGRVLRGKEGKELARGFRCAAAYLGKSIAITANLLSTDLVILGGGVALGLESLLPVVDDQCRGHTISTIAEKMKIRLSSFGDMAGLMGSAALGLDYFIYKRSFLAALDSTI